MTDDLPEDPPVEPADETPTTILPSVQPTECPFCGCKKFAKHRVQAGVQKLRCRDCRKEFRGAPALPTSDPVSQKILDLCNSILISRKLSPSPAVPFPDDYDWRTVPKDLEGNLRHRQGLLRHVCRGPDQKRAVLQKCRDDLLFWINAFTWQFNPNPVGDQLEYGPFITYPFQDEGLMAMNSAIDRRLNIPVEKSRELGASYALLLVFGHRWLFKPLQKFLLISRDADSVDKTADSDSLMWKLDFILDRLPLWMMPKEWDRRKHRLRMRLLNPENQSMITGQASTGSAGISGRATAIGIDEFSRIKEAADLRQGTASTSACRIFISTHKGVNSEFHLLCQKARNKIVWHWLQHPEKQRGAYRWWPKDEFDERPRGVVNEIGKISTWMETGVEILDPDYQYDADFKFQYTKRPAGGPFPGIRSPWYDQKCEEIGRDSGIAEELDIDPMGSTAQLFDAIRIHDLIKLHCRPPLWQGDVEADSDSRGVKLVERPGGPLLLWCNFLSSGRPKAGLYAGGGDVASGLGVTPSCFSLAQCHAGSAEKVLEYANAHIQPVQFARLCVSLCWFFQTADGVGAKMAWDMGGSSGEWFTRTIIELGYRNVYYRADENSLAQRTSDRPGWAASGPSKKLLLEEYDYALQKGQFTNRSKAAMEETLLFKFKTAEQIEHSGSVNESDPAQAGMNHGDRVIADALCWKMAKSQGAGVLKIGERLIDEIMPGTFGWRREMRARREQRDRAESWRLRPV